MNVEGNTCGEFREIVGQELVELKEKLARRQASYVVGDGYIQFSEVARMTPARARRISDATARLHWPPA